MERTPLFDRYYAYFAAKLRDKVWAKIAELRERLWENYTEEPNSGCWIWTGAIDSGGYGRMSFLGRVCSASRLVYELERGSIPIGFQIDHLCRVRSCVNPDHLEPVTAAENVRRGDAPRLSRIRQLSRTVCKRGHPLEGDNLYILPSAGWRVCRACHLSRLRKYYAKLPKKGPNLEGLKLHREHQKAKTHCPRGHPYSGENLGFQKNGTGRVCRTCSRTRRNEANRKKREMKPMSITDE